MFKDGSLSKQTIAVIDKYLKHHGLHTASNKHCKANGGAKAHYSTTDTGFYTRRGKSTLQYSENEEEYLSSDDESIETDYVLAEIGSSSENGDEEGDDIQITLTTTRSGRRATSYLR